MSLADRVERLWYGPAWRSLPLWPLAILYGMVVTVRRSMYRLGLLRTGQVDVPIVVVGNLTVGGTGKTPIAAWLVRELQRRGRAVGVVMRGYGGTHRGRPRVVQLSDNPSVVGDEALVHARHGAHVVVIGADRLGAAQLAQREGADVIVSDDGLQHLRLPRDVEIVVVDGTRGLGNGWLLPAGPLRERAARLESVQALVTTWRESTAEAMPLESHAGRANAIRAKNPLHVTARMVLGEAVNLMTGERKPLTAFAHVHDLHAVAGVGHPHAFFNALRAAGLDFIEHALADHGALDLGRLPFPSTATVLMTEKDAVKYLDCAGRDWWWIELDVQVARHDAAVLLASVLDRTGLTGAGVTLG
jgi:tetraacyldisaccharide 4'-kinase